MPPVEILKPRTLAEAVGILAHSGAAVPRPGSATT